MRKVLLLVTTIFLWITAIQAAYLEKVPVVLFQPNGNTLYCFATGDDYYQWLHDKDNYTIILDQTTGFYVYANLERGQLVPTNLIPGVDSPKRVLSPGLNISAQKMRLLREKMEVGTREAPPKNNFRNIGTMNNIVIFIRLADADDFTQPITYFNSIFNDSSSVADVSVYNYVKKTSYQQLFVSSHFFPAPNGDTIIAYQDIYPIQYYMPYSEENTIGYLQNDTISERTEREHALLKRAVQFAANSIPTSMNLDFNGDGFVDNISFIIQGELGAWASLLWPHRWSLFSEEVYIHGLRVWDYNFLMTHPAYLNTSVLSHELLHTFGFPDLYRYSYEGTPVGTWDIMAGNGNPPQQTGAYLKWKYGGWIEGIPEITEAGFYTLYSNQNHKEGSVYKIASPDPNQFFILEYRKKEPPFDLSIPSSGVIISRINQLYDGNAETDFIDYFDEVYIYRSEGTMEDDGNIYAAAFSQNSFLNQFNPWTNPYPFLTDGTVCFFELNQFGIPFRDSITFYYSPEPVGVQENIVDAGSVKLFPNPAQDQITIWVDAEDGEVIDYQLIDIHGRVVLAGQLQVQNNYINVSQLSPGIYFANIRQGETENRIKFIKQ